VVHYGAIETGHFCAGSAYKQIIRFFRKKFSQIQILGYFQVLPGHRLIAAGHQADAGYGFASKGAAVARYAFEVESIGISLAQNRITIHGTVERFAESGQRSFEVPGSTIMVATRPEEFHEPVVMDPLVAGDQKIAEQESRFLAAPGDNDRSIIAIDR
jgi:hypothetical protein